MASNLETSSAVIVWDREPTARYYYKCGDYLEPDSNIDPANAKYDLCFLTSSAMGIIHDPFPKILQVFKAVCVDIIHQCARVLTRTLRDKVSKKAVAKILKQHYREQCRHGVLKDLHADIQAKNKTVTMPKMRTAVAVIARKSKTLKIIQA